MISRNDIVAWGVEHPWPEMDQIEQDLLLSQAICVISNDELLGEELALRGGTAFHKLFLDQPFRYSEDLDYVRTTEGGIGPVMRRLTDIGKELGYDVSTKMGMYPKVYWRFTADSGLRGKIKIEINTYEREPVQGFLLAHHDVGSPYYSGKASVRTFHIEELIATKIRALYQRSKGRDLYDIWLALTEAKADSAVILNAFSGYRPEGFRGEDIVANLENKLRNPQFVSDTANLIRQGAPAYDPQQAGEFIITELLSKL